MINQQITEISSYVDAVEKFIEFYKMPNQCKDIIYNKMIRDMRLFDDDSNQFYTILINSDKNIFICDTIEVNIELIWNTMSRNMFSLVTEHNGVIPISVIISAYNKYIFFKSVMEMVFQYFYIADGANRDTVIEFPIIVGDMDKDGITKFSKSIIPMYNMHEQLSGIYHSVAETYSDISEYYTIDFVSQLYHSIDMNENIINIGILYDYIDFSISPGNYMSVVLNVDENNIPKYNTDIACLDIDIRRCEYLSNPDKMVNMLMSSDSEFANLIVSRWEDCDDVIFELAESNDGFEEYIDEIDEDDDNYDDI